MRKLKEHGIAGVLFSRVPKESLKSGGILMEDRWQDMPKGWDASSRDKYADSMSHEEECEGAVDTCMHKIGDNVDDPGAFCASLHDRVTGTTQWRGSGGG